VHIKNGLIILVNVIGDSDVSIKYKSFVVDTYTKVF